MASSEDFQRVYELYKTEGVPKGISIVNFCQQNNLTYRQMLQQVEKLDERKEEIYDLRDFNNCHNKMTVGNKSTSRKHKRYAQNLGRDSVVSEEPLDKTKVKSEHLDAKHGPRGPYS